MSLGEFLGSTLRLINLLTTARDDVRTREVDFPAGVIGAILLNVNRDAKERPEAFTPEDVISTLAPKKQKNRVNTVEQARALEIKEAELFYQKSLLVFRQFTKPKH